MTNTSINKKRVVVAMSGGVDSSVAALILTRQGYEVIGISLKVWDETSTVQRKKTCCSFSDIQDARRVCDRLGVPFYAFNYQDIFKEKVIDHFVDEYRRGRTPNPCILCNNHIKFDQLLHEAGQLGADYLATGHHARCLIDGQGVAHLMRGRDRDKDQSYVLHRLTQPELRKILFPVGEFTKDQIRAMAREVQLPTAQKPESQDICFVPNRDYAAFMNQHYPEAVGQPGAFVDVHGRELGQHRGVHAYTIGQRRGLGVGLSERHYVTAIDVANNQIQLGSHDDLMVDGLIADQVSWIQPPTADYRDRESWDCEVKVRYQKEGIPATITEVRDREVRVVFKQRYPAVTPGQAAVFYQGDEVMGGGWIERAVRGSA